MPKTLIAALTASLLLVIFGIQNATEIPVKLYFWEVYSSLSLIIILSIILGAMVGSLFTITSYAKKLKKKQASEKLQNQKSDYGRYENTPPVS